MAMFSRENVKRIAQDFLSREAKGASLARLTIATDQHSLDNNYGHGTPHNTYASTVADIERDGFPKGPLARLLSIGGFGKLSYLMDGTLSEDLLGSSSDPVVLHESKYSYELLHFILGTPGQASSPSAYDLRLFFRASPDVSIESCVRIFEALRKTMQIKPVIMEVRPHPWYMEEQRYPAVLAFTKPAAIPNSLQYLTSPRIICGVDKGQIRCSGHSLVP